MVHGPGSNHTDSQCLLALSTWIQLWRPAGIRPRFWRKSQDTTQGTVRFKSLHAAPYRDHVERWEYSWSFNGDLYKIRGDSNQQWSLVKESYRHWAKPVQEHTDVSFKQQSYKRLSKCRADHVLHKIQDASHGPIESNIWHAGFRASFKLIRPC